YGERHVAHRFDGAEALRDAVEANDGVGHTAIRRARPPFEPALRAKLMCWPEACTSTAGRALPSFCRTLRNNHAIEGAATLSLPPLPVARSLRLSSPTRRGRDARASTRLDAPGVLR